MLTTLCQVNECQADCEQHSLLPSNAQHHTRASDLRATHTWEGLFTVGNCKDLLDSWEIIALLKGIPTVV